jgi:acyl carrier protein
MALLDSEERTKKIQAAFAGREALDERTFYERYFINRGVTEDVVGRFRRVLADELNADMSRLRAEDDFERNLSFFWEFDSMADVELIIRLEEEFGIKIKDTEAQQASSVADMVELVWSKLRAREA